MTGPLIATALLTLGFSMRGVFALAAVPAALAVLAVLWVREPPRKVASVVAEDSPSVAINMGADPKPRLPKTFLGFLAVLLVFSLGNASDAFLILRASEAGVSAAWIPLMWSAMHAVKLATSWACGSLSDRRGRVPLIATGWLFHVACFAALALTTSPLATCVLAALHGVVAGLTEPSERALVGDLVPDAMRGRAFGAYNAALGLAALPAGVLTGWIWTRHGGAAALSVSAGLGLVATALLLVFARRFAVSRLSRG